MINDLIKRMDAIENIWSLFNNTYNDATRFDAEETELAKRILSDVQTVLEKQPTAYNVDKVVEQMETNSMYTHESIEPYIVLDDAIEIIKSGGIGQR